MLREWQATVAGGRDDGETVALPGRPEAFAGEDAVRYVTTVDDPRGPDEDVAVLHLDGCYARATVELSGSVLGDVEGPVEHDVYYAPLRIPFRPADEERIAVTCEPPADRFGGVYDTQRVPAEERVPGVWWSADLETHSLPFVDRVTVTPELTEDGALLHVRTTVVTDGPLDERLTYSLKPAGDLQTRGTMERRSVETRGPGRTTVAHEIEVRDPALWWPRGYGDQDRYELQAKLGQSERSVTTGIRSVEREGGDLVVNDQAVPVRGVNLLTPEAADVERALSCNANLVRAHAGALPPAIYEACDEAGLLVWQDLPLTGPGGFDVDRGRELAAAVGDAYGHHPSLAAVGVHDEPTGAFAEGLGDGFLDRLRLRWRAWRTDYDVGPAERVAEAAPDLPTFPVVGDPGVATDARRLFPGWDYGDAGWTGALLDRYPADVVAAFGAGALGEGQGDSDGDGVTDFDAAKHDAHVDGGNEASQAYQAATVQTVAEALRRRGVGAVAYALRDADDAGMGIYTRGGEPKAARDALARAYEPLQAFLATPEAARSEVVVCNDGPQATSGELAWRAGDEDGRLDVTVGAAGRWTGGPISIPADAERVELAFEGGGRSVRNVYDRS